MFAADDPQGSVAEGVQFMDAADITPEQRMNIYSGNARRIFGLR